MAKIEGSEIASRILSLLINLLSGGALHNELKAQFIVQLPFIVLTLLATKPCIDLLKLLSIILIVFKYPTIELINKKPKNNLTY
ncbi:MAG: hypothetical protein GY777_11640 [Candidatus Brocadiaceae bacterium]|nr:hypothetical protein [Candidatus Brocadiaceae bacterium]